MATKTQRHSLWDSICQRVASDERFRELAPWIDHLQVQAEDENKIVLSLLEPHLDDFLADRFLYLLQEAATSVNPERSASPPRIIFESPRCFQIRNQVVNANMNFAAFYAGPGNRLARAAAEAVATDPGQRYNPLFLHAGIGQGKTHLLQAIYQELLANHRNLLVYYLSADDFLNQLFHAAKKSMNQAYRNELSRADVLLIDDIQLLAGQETGQDEFFHIFNTLYNRQRQIVVAGNASPRSLLTLSERLTSRLQWGLVVEIEPPTLAMREEIIRRKSKVFGLELSASVRQYLAESTFANIRELEGILHKLDSHARLLAKPLDLSLIKEVLGGYAHKPKQRVTMAQIHNFICNHFGVDQADLLSKSRARSIAFPRQVGMHLAHMTTSASLEEIGKSFGGRDHSTVKHGCEKIKRLAQKDPAIRGLVQDFLRAVATPQQ